MEEQRISRMYWNLLTGRIQRFFDGFGSGDAPRSGLLPIAILVVVVAIPAALWIAHSHARFHKLREHMGAEPATEAQAGPRPGGREAIVLTRTPAAAATQPELTSVTLLPGLGLDVLQITASLPGKGPVSLLLAPTVQEAADGAFDNAGNGPDDLHGALELPWAGGLPGAQTPLGSALSVRWENRPLLIPGETANGSTLAQGGMLRMRDATSVQQSNSAEGTNLQGSFATTDFEGHWPSHLETEVHASLSSSTLELIITAHNTGEEATPVGIGWTPRFSLQNTDRSLVQLRLPQGEQLQYSNKKMLLATGSMTAPESPLAEFTGHSHALGSSDLDGSLGRLRTGLLDSEIGAELRNPAARYGVRFTAVSPNVRQLRVYAPASAPYVELGLQTNYDNPFGHGWTSQDPGIAVLQPGASLQYKIRLEIFPLAAQ